MSTDIIPRSDGIILPAEFAHLLKTREGVTSSSGLVVVSRPVDDQITFGERTHVGRALDIPDWFDPDLPLAKRPRNRPVVDRANLEVPYTDEPASEFTVFIDPHQPDQLYFVPTYVLAERRVGTEARYEMSLAPKGDGFELAVALTAQRPPTAPQGALPLDCTLRLQLIHLAPVADGGTVQRSHEFSVVVSEEGCVATLQVDELGERDEIYHALTTASAEPQLRLDRSIRVAVRSAVDEVTPPVVIDMLELSPHARWGGAQLTDTSGNSRDGVALPFNGSDGDANGFVILSSSIALEDGTDRRALRTHPKWVDFGTIKGHHPMVELPPRATFLAQVGFVRGAAHSDGVEFIVFAHYDLPDGRRNWVEVLRHKKLYTGFLDSVSADLAHLRAQQVGLELRVDAGSSSGQDWAAWVDPRIVGEDPEPLPPRYLVTTSTFTQNIMPVPFVDKELHRYIFEGLSGIGSGMPALTHHAVAFEGTVHHYYQRSSDRGVFLCLPDVYRLGRRTEVPRNPSLSVRFTSPDGNADNLVAEVAYVAYPILDTRRIEAAKPALRAESPLLDPAAEITFEVLRSHPDSVTYRLMLPAASGAFERSVREGSFVAFDREIVDVLRLDLPGFQAVFDAVMGIGGSPLFTGEVLVTIGQTDTLAVPLVARLTQLAGGVASVTSEQERPGVAHVSVRNECESPIRLTALPPTQLHSAGVGVEMVTSDPQVDGVAATLPALLAPMSVLRYRAEASVPRAEQMDVRVDLSRLTVEPNPDLVWQSMLDASVPAGLTFEVPVTVFRDVFQLHDELKVVVVEFADGTALSFNQTEFGTDVPSVVKTAQLPLPLDAVVRHNKMTAAYKYRIVAVVGLGMRPPSVWIEASGPLFPDLSSIGV
ncbi:hypothetical protein ACX80N_17005 [Arthrobacter sp. MDT2-16]